MIQINFPSTEFDLYKSKNNRNIIYDAYKLTPGDKVVVFLSYGKVGSTAVCRTLERVKSPSGNPVPVYHIHNFAPDILNSPDPSKLLPHHLSAAALREVFDAHREDFEWRFITGVRDPISLLISGFFENRFAVDGPPTNEMLLKYARTFIPWAQEHADTHFHQHTGIDLYGETFDIARGWSIQKHQSVEVLIYRLDRLSDIFQNAIEAFIGVPGLRLATANISNQKEIVSGGVSYGNAYAEVKRRFRIAENELAAILDHISVQHFFTHQEITKLRDQWAAETD